MRSDAVEIEVISGSNYNRRPGSRYIGPHVTTDKIQRFLDDLDQILEKAKSRDPML